MTIPAAKGTTMTKQAETILPFTTEDKKIVQLTKVKIGNSQKKKLDALFTEILAKVNDDDYADVKPLIARFIIEHYPDADALLVEAFLFDWYEQWLWKRGNWEDVDLIGGVKGI